MTRQRKDRPQPEIVIVNRKRYIHALFHIIDYDNKGRPKTLELLPDNDEKIDVTEKTAFMTGYVPESMVDLDILHNLN